MNRIKAAVSLVIGVLLLGNLAPQLVCAHGGRVAPPPPPPPPNNAPAPGSAAGPAGPLGSGPVSGPSSGSGPVGGIPTAPSRPTGTQPTSGQPSGPAPVDLTEWTWWWQFNREPFLTLKAHVRSGAPMSGSSEPFLGRGAQSDFAGPGYQFAWDQVRPALVEILRAKQTSKISNDELTAVMIALGKIIRDAPAGHAQDLAELTDAIGIHLTHSNQEVAETAVISLGIAGGYRSSLLIADLLMDNEAGRKLLGRRQVPMRTRSFAAYALALLGAQNQNEDLRRLVVHRLIAGLESDDSASADLQVACVIALGRVALKLAPSDSQTPGLNAPSSSSLQAQVRYLLAQLKQANLHRLALAHIPTSLGFLMPGEASASAIQLKQEVAQALLKLLKPGSRAAREIQQSAMIALGMIGDDDIDPIDAQIRKVLDGAWKSFKDDHTRHMATIALAQTSTRRGASDHASGQPVQKALLKGMSSRRDDRVRWSALALGIHGLQRTPSGDAGASVNSIDPVATGLSKHLRDARSPLNLGAFVTGIGILGSPLGMRQVEKKLAAASSDRTLGHVAVGAGLINLKSAIPKLQEWIQSTSYRIFLTQELAIALALLEDRSVAPMLVSRLAQAKSLTSQATLAQALGRVGDERTLEPLLALLKNQQVSSRARAFAAVALGIVADQQPLPWNTILKVNLNYMASTETLFDLRGYGVLNIF